MPTVEEKYQYLLSKLYVANKDVWEGDAFLKLNDLYFQFEDDGPDTIDKCVEAAMLAEQPSHNTITVSGDSPPPYLFGGEYWERSSDPFHWKALGNIPTKNIVIIGKELSQGERKDGWLLIDYAENPIGFIPDGTQYEGNDKLNQVKYTFHVGPCKHICAYPPNSEKRIEQHQRRNDQKNTS
jgi:hypothetical protein